jgi:hypothetical protein
VSEKERKHEYCYKSTAIKLLGLSPKKFEQLGLKPDKIVSNPHYRSAAPSQLFNRKRIEQLAETPEVIALQPKKRKPKDWGNVFSKRYEDRESSIIDVANAMFNLNRYAKHETCAARNRAEIYHLKNLLIRHLYNMGLCISVGVHQKTLQRKECWHCDGTGIG